MTHTPDLSIIIVSWNTKALLRTCLQSVFAETQAHSLEVFVVDNHSPDGSAEMVAEEFPQVRLIANQENMGFARANNQALEQATGRYLLLLNPDTEIRNGAIDRMLHYADAHREDSSGILTCKLLNPDLSLQKSVNRFYSFWRSFVENRFFAELFRKLNLRSDFFMNYWDHNSEREIDWAHGAVMLFSREVFEAVGLLDDRFYIYAEEIDYYLRVRKAGFHSRFLPQAEIIHYGSSSARQRRSQMFIQNYKSFYLLLKKHYGRLSYLLYRTRALVYLFAWYLIFSLKKDEEARTQKRVYAETIQWHFSRQSWSLE